jgi:hypothetical protein
MKHKIFGVAFDHDVLKANDLFDTIRDVDDEVVLASKETYHHKEDDGSLDFDYKYVMHAKNQYEMTGEAKDENKWGIELKIVPMPDSLLSNVLSDTAELHEEGEDEVELIDIVDDGKCVQLGFELVDVSDGYDKVMPVKFDEGASVVETINAMRSFYLDRPWNKVGSTGWDILNTYVGNGEDYIKVAFERRSK